MPTEGEIKLNEDIRLANADENFQKRFPLPGETTPLSALGEGILRQRGSWASKAEYLQIGVSGFIGPYAGSIPYWNAERTLRSFCGLGIGLRLFEVVRRFTPEPVHSHFLMHRQFAEDGKFQRKMNLSAELSRALNTLQVHSLDGKLDSEAKKFRWAQSRLSKMKVVFSSGAKAESVLLASQWLFDSYTGHDELLSYVQAMVVLEILLGDKAASDEIGLGRLLSNRCAYLVGNNYEERADILRDFKEIYGVCSEIVHRGKSRLNRQEMRLFSNLHWMCRRVIQKEVTLLEADAQEDGAS